MGKEAVRASLLTLALILVPALTSCATPTPPPTPTPDVEATKVAMARALEATMTALAPMATITPYPTYTPAESASRTTDCVALAAFLTAMDTPAADYDRHLGQWNQWMKRVYEESVPSEAILERLAEFWLDLGEIRDQVTKIRPPREARNIHELFLKMMVEEKRAVELWQGYYTTQNERHRSDANAALAQNGVLRREYDGELTDLWESCFGVPLEETKYP